MSSVGVLPQALFSLSSSSPLLIPFFPILPFSVPSPSNCPIQLKSSCCVGIQLSHEAHPPTFARQCPPPSLLVHPCHSAGFSMIIPLRPPCRLVPLITSLTTSHYLIISFLLDMNVLHPLLSPLAPELRRTLVLPLTGAPVILPRGPAGTRTLALGMMWPNGGTLLVRGTEIRKISARRPHPLYKSISTARTRNRMQCTKKGRGQLMMMATIVHPRLEGYADTLSPLTHFPLTTFPV